MKHGMEERSTAVRLADEFAVAAHIRHLMDRSQYVRERAAKDLGRLGDSRALTPLIEALLHDTSFSVRRSAAYALGTLGDARAVKTLIQALDDTSACVRTGAIEALGMLGYCSIIEPLVKALIDDESMGVRERATEVVETLIDALKAVRQHVYEAAH